MYDDLFVMRMVGSCAKRIFLTLVNTKKKRLALRVYYGVSTALREVCILRR